MSRAGSTDTIPSVNGSWMAIAYGGRNQNCHTENGNIDTHLFRFFVFPILHRVVYVAKHGLY